MKVIFSERNVVGQLHAKTNVGRRPEKESFRLDNIYLQVSPEGFGTVSFRFQPLTALWLQVGFIKRIYLHKLIIIQYVH